MPNVHYGEHLRSTKPERTRDLHQEVSLELLPICRAAAGEHVNMAPVASALAEAAYKHATESGTSQVIQGIRHINLST